MVRFGLQPPPRLRASRRRCPLPSLLTSACQSASLVQSNPRRRLRTSPSPWCCRPTPTCSASLVGREAVGALGTPRHEVDTAQLQRAQFDQRAYVIWKQSVES